MLELVQDLAVDPDLPPDSENPFRQVVINTHSPGVVQLCHPQDLLLADVRTIMLPEGGSARALSLAPFKKSWRSVGDRLPFTEADVVAYLAAPAGSQLKLPMQLTG